MITKTLASTLKPGDKVELSSCSYMRQGSHNYAKHVHNGYVFTVSKIATVGRELRIYENDTYYTVPSCIKIVNIKPLDKTYLQNKKKELESKIKHFTNNVNKEIEEINNKLCFLDETKSDSYNEDEFKVYQTLTIIEQNSNMSKLDKAKAITKLIKQQ